MTEPCCTDPPHFFSISLSSVLFFASLLTLVLFSFAYCTYSISILFSLDSCFLSSPPVSCVPCGIRLHKNETYIEISFYV